MRYIVIGSNGYIGSHLSRHIAASGHELSCYDIQNVHEKNYSPINLLDKEQLAAVNFDVDAVFLMAGLTGTYAGFDKYTDYIDINEKALCNLLDAIRKSSYRPRVVFPSSRLVYKGSETALKEEDPKEAKTIYAVNKIACEHILQAYSNSFCIPYTVLRICVPYGNIETIGYSFGTIGFFMKMAATGNDITLYGGGMQKRTFTSVSDICEIMLRCSWLGKAINQIYNIGGEVLSLHQAACLIAGKYHVSVKATDWPQRDLLIESGSTFFDDSRLQETLSGYRYNPLSESINRI